LLLDFTPDVFATNPPRWKENIDALTSTRAHLPALAAKTSHALLSPLGSHAAVNADEESHSVGLLNHGVQGALLELSGAEHDALQAYLNDG